MRRILFALVAVLPAACGSLPGDYEAAVTTTLSTNSSMVAANRVEDVKVTEQGGEVTIGFPACPLKAKRSGNKLDFITGQRCTRDLKAVTLTSGQGETKSGQVLLAFVWSKEGTSGSINERAILSPKSGCR